MSQSSILVTLCILAILTHNEKYMQTLNFIFEGLVVKSLTWEISQTKYSLAGSKNSPIKSILIIKKNLVS